AGRLVEPHPLDLGNRGDPRGEQTLDFLNREQRAAEGETVVGKLRHQEPPSQPPSAASGTALASIRSATASTSSSATTGTRAGGGAASDATATMCGSSGWSDGLPIAAR